MAGPVNSSALPHDVQYLQGTLAAPATINGAGTAAKSAGYLGCQQLEIIETKGGTATVTLTGTFGSPGGSYAVGYAQVDNTASPARSVSAISVTANSNHIYQILDPYTQLQATISAISSAGVIVRLHLWP